MKPETGTQFMFMKQIIITSATFIISLFFDYISKLWLLKFLPGFGQQRDVIKNFFSIVNRRNPGVAFSLFQNLKFAPVIFSVVAVVAVIFIGRIICIHKDLPCKILIGLGLVAGGAVGNTIDRIFPPHKVLDFLDFYYAGYHWPAFNIADSAICIGAALLILSTFTDPHAFSNIEKTENDN